MRLGKNQKHLLAFARKYTGWHTYAKNPTTLRTVRSLVHRNLLTINDYRQFRIMPDQMLAVCVQMSDGPEFIHQ